jgi:outer membrane lipoprotein-sorting protein
MTNDERNPNDQVQMLTQATDGLGFRDSSFFRPSSFVLRHWATLLLCLSIAPCVAQRQPEQRPLPLNPAQAESEARALVAEMLSQKPAQTNTGLLKIRDGNGVQRRLPMRFVIWSTATCSTSVYEVQDPGPPRRDLKLTVVHTDGRPNQYLLSENGGTAKTLTGNEAMIPFASSDFWVADLGLEFLHWPQQRLSKKEMRRSRFCDVLESVNPQPAADGYSRVVSWIEQEPPHGIVHADAYDAKGERIKQFDPKEFEKIQGEYQLQEMEIHRKSGARSSIEFDLTPGNR